MTVEFRDIQSIVVSFNNRDNVPTALVIDGNNPAAELVASVVVSQDGLDAEIGIRGQVPNGTGYTFKSLEDYDLRFVRRDEVGHLGEKRHELGPVGRIVSSVVLLAIVTPLVGILWAWAAGVVRGLGGLW